MSEFTKEMHNMGFTYDECIGKWMKYYKKGDNMTEKKCEGYDLTQDDNMPMPKLKKPRPRTATGMVRETVERYMVGAGELENEPMPRPKLSPMNWAELNATYRTMKLENDSPDSVFMERPKDSTLWETGKEMAKVSYFKRYFKSYLELESISVDELKKWIKKTSPEIKDGRGFTITDSEGEQVGEDIFPITKGVYTIQLIKEEKDESGSNKPNKGR